jgi:hypothetical protein
MRYAGQCGLTGATIAVVVAIVTMAGCHNTPVNTSEYARGPVPLREPAPERLTDGKHCNSYEDSLDGGKVFAMYCSQCHNPPSLGERNFANFRNVASHMRVRANLTGKEYARLMEFLRRWNDVPPPNPPLDPSPKLLIFSQPINELRPEGRPNAAASQGQPQPKDLPPPKDAKLP